MSEAHRESGALIINSDSRHFSQSLKVLLLLMFPELPEPPSAIIIYRFFSLIKDFYFF